ncbi:hypothetical protein PIB30_085299 [Stylosanthes scabra]|uniref:Uncharacterized protein n=1 Tax=Stylosanthes scabra TaxID=79078 RepID=A0ABU6VRK4_9FABA|nr:hypothetical protein [Stylosanthes scabra]
MSKWVTSSRGYLSSTLAAADDCSMDLLEVTVDFLFPGPEETLTSAGLRTRSLSKNPRRVREDSPWASKHRAIGDQRLDDEAATESNETTVTRAHKVAGNVRREEIWRVGESYSVSVVGGEQSQRERNNS